MFRVIIALCIMPSIILVAMEVGVCSKATGYSSLVSVTLVIGNQSTVCDCHGCLASWLMWCAFSDVLLVMCF